jgi:divalent metal cation (Fe/Co/Zn/Cd) transporter
MKDKQKKEWLWIRYWKYSKVLTSLDIISFLIMFFSGYWLVGAIGAVAISFYLSSKVGWF